LKACPKVLNAPPLEELIMPKIEVYDPPMCCSTGVCGPEPDEQLTRFSADLDWLKHQGVAVRRYNLAQEPTAFTSHPDVARIVSDTSGDGLPVVALDGRVVSQGEYPSRQRLAELVGINGDTGADQKEAPVEQPPEGPAMFDERIAELVALGAAIAANCEPCLRYHHRKAVELGINREDMIQAVNVAFGVKEQSAQMITRTAQRLLIPEAAQGGGCCGSDSGEGGCC